MLQFELIDTHYTDDKREVRFNDAFTKPTLSSKAKYLAEVDAGKW